RDAAGRVRWVAAGPSASGGWIFQKKGGFETRPYVMSETFPAYGRKSSRLTLSKFFGMARSKRARSTGSATDGRVASISHLVPTRWKLERPGIIGETLSSEKTRVLGISTTSF